jgi:hypothetical protein
MMLDWLLIGGIVVMLLAIARHAYSSKRKHGDETQVEADMAGGAKEPLLSQIALSMMAGGAK